MFFKFCCLLRKPPLYSALNRFFLNRNSCKQIQPFQFVQPYRNRDESWQLQMNYYALKMWVPDPQCFSPKMNNRHPWQLKKSKSWGPFWSYQLNSTANFAHLPRNQTKWAELAVLLSWQLQNGPQNFYFSTAMGAKFIAT